MENYPRKAHFDYFRSLGYPYIGTTVNVDVSELVRVCKENGVSFYLAFMHAAALVDGMHLARFYENVKAEMKILTERISSHAG